MEPEKIIKEINKLGLSEKIMLVEDVWDSIAQDNAELPMPEWQKNELKKRYGDFKGGKMTLHDWNDIHEGIRNKYKCDCATSS